MPPWLPRRKLAIGKSDETTKERLDSLERLMETNFAALRESYADLKGRIDRGEGGQVAVKESKDDKRADWGLIILAASLLIAAIVAVVGFA
jgi:signal transduction histidine kinase